MLAQVESVSQPERSEAISGAQTVKGYWCLSPCGSHQWCTPRSIPHNFPPWPFHYWQLNCEDTRSPSETGHGFTQWNNTFNHEAVFFLSWGQMPLSCHSGFVSQFPKQNKVNSKTMSFLIKRNKHDNRTLINVHNKWAGIWNYLIQTVVVVVSWLVGPIKMVL